MYYNEEQQLLAQSWKENLSNKFEDPVVTEIVPAWKFTLRKVTTKIITQNPIRVIVHLLSGQS